MSGQGPFGVCATNDPERLVDNITGEDQGSPRHWLLGESAPSFIAVDSSALSPVRNLVPAEAMLAAMTDLGPFARSAHI